MIKPQDTTTNSQMMQKAGKHVKPYHSDAVSKIRTVRNWGLDNHFSLKIARGKKANGTQIYRGAGAPVRSRRQRKARCNEKKRDFRVRPFRAQRSACAFSQEQGGSSTKNQGRAAFGNAPSGAAGGIRTHVRLLAN